MAVMLVVFSWLTDIDVSYKTVERLYSDQEVVLVLHNLHILKDKIKENNDTKERCILVMLVIDILSP